MVDGHANSTRCYDNEQTHTAPPASLRRGLGLEPSQGHDRGSCSVWNRSKKRDKSKNTSGPSPLPNLTLLINTSDSYGPAPVVLIAAAIESAQVEEKSHAQPNDVNLHFGNDHVFSTVDPGYSIEAKSGHCPRRIEHGAT
jgi:hypothetical protein